MKGLYDAEMVIGGNRLPIDVDCIGGCCVYFKKKKE